MKFVSKNKTDGFFIDDLDDRKKKEVNNIILQHKNINKFNTYFISPDNKILLSNEDSLIKQKIAYSTAQEFNTHIYHVHTYKLSFYTKKEILRRLKIIFDYLKEEERKEEKIIVFFDNIESIMIKNVLNYLIYMLNNFSSNSIIFVSSITESYKNIMNFIDKIISCPCISLIYELCNEYIYDIFKVLPLKSINYEEIYEYFRQKSEHIDMTYLYIKKCRNRILKNYLINNYIEKVDKETLEKFIG